jgi:hypothetical protein
MLFTGDGLKILDSADKSVKVSAGDRDKWKTRIFRNLD